MKKDSAGTAKKTGQKRDADQVDGTEAESTKKAKDAQKTSSKVLNIPVDQAFIAEAVFFPRKLASPQFSGLTD